MKIPLRFLRDENGLWRLLLVTAVIFAALSFLVPGRFLSVRNFASMSFQIPEIGLLSIAMMAAMISGGIDLSAVGIANLSGILASQFLLHYAPEGSGGTWAALVVAVSVGISLAVGAGCGLLNGLLVTRVGIPPILATLGTMQLFSGLAIVLTRGTALYGFPDAFLILGNGYLFSVPVPLVLFAAAVLLVGVLLRRTSFGFSLYLVGTNPTAARFAGLDNAAILVKTYMLSGVLCASAGLVMFARTNSAKADYGVSYTLQAILVAVLGGTNVAGGFGSMAGLVLAILSLQFLSSGFAMLRFSNFSKEFVWGALLLAVMALNVLGDRAARKMQGRKNGTAPQAGGETEELR